jgi:hypothetical protein
MENELREMQLRLQQAERRLSDMRQASRRRRALAFAAVAGAAWFLATRPAATQSQWAMILQAAEPITVKGPLVVVDDAGRPIMQVGAGPSGRGLVLFDEGGNMISGIGLTSQGRGVMVFDSELRPIAGLGEGQSPDGVANGRGLTVLDTSQKVIATLGQGEDGPSRGRGLTVNDAGGAPAAGLGVWPQRPDRGQLLLTESDGTPIFAQPALP